MENNGPFLLVITLVLLHFGPEIVDDQTITKPECVQELTTQGLDKATIREVC